MHAALQQVLGEHVQQKGSLVAPDYLRFDFAHDQAMTAEEITAVENLVNEQVFANTPVTTELMSMEEAKAAGAMALFGEKYDDQVRVLTMGQEAFSKELCGGTHVANTGQIGLFKITHEGASSAGVRRIEAVCGEYALAFLQQREAALLNIASQLKVSPEQASTRVEQLMQRTREQERELARLKQQLATGSGTDLRSQAKEVNGVQVVAAELNGADNKALRMAVDKLKDQLGTAVILLAATEGEKITLVAGVTKDVCQQYPAGELIRHVAQQVDGKGGGRPDMAQGGGSNPQALPAALESVTTWVTERG